MSRTLQPVTVGPPDGTPIVTLHSGPGESHHLLRPWLDALADERHRVIYYDQLGSGGWQDHVADLDGLLTKLGSSSPILLGHSWGALLSLLFASEHPGRIAKLILVSPAPLRSADAGLVRAGEETSRRRPEVVAAQKKFLATGAAFAAQVAPYLANPERAIELPPIRRDEAAAREVRASLGNYDLTSRLERLVGLPTLVLHGAADPIPAELAERTALLLRASFELLPGAGHAPFFEQPDAFLRSIRRFLHG